MGLIVIQPDFSSAAMIGLIGFMMLFVGGAKISHLMATGAVSLMILTPIMLMKPYRLQRVLTFFYGESAGVQESYQIKQSLISLWFYKCSSRYWCCSYYRTANALY